MLVQFLIIEMGKVYFYTRVRNEWIVSKRMKTSDEIEKKHWNTFEKIQNITTEKYNSNGSQFQ